MPVKLGLGLPQMRQYSIGRDVPTVAGAAESIGYDSLWVFEVNLFPTPMTQGFHNVPGLPWPDYFRGAADPLVVLMLAAAASQHARLGTSVLVAPRHLPFQLARSLASLDVASGGRVVAGLGGGWSRDEMAASPVAPFERRGALLDEVLDVCAAVWGPDPVSYKGEWTTIVPSEVGPKPVGPLPIYLAALTERSQRRLVDRADGWMPVASGASRLAEEHEKIKELALRRGRRRPLEVCVRVTTEYQPDPIPGTGRRLFQGSVEQITADVLEHVQATQVDELIIELQITPRDAEELVDVAAETYAALRAAGV